MSRPFFNSNRGGVASSWPNIVIAFPGFGSGRATDRHRVARAFLAVEVIACSCSASLKEPNP